VELVLRHVDRLTQQGYGFHRPGASCSSRQESLAMLLRPGNAGSSTVSDHIEVLAAALAELPARWRSKLLIRIDGAGASHDLVTICYPYPRGGGRCCSPAAR
jgi:hypothetical protein